MESLRHSSNTGMLSAAMFRLLPIQVLMIAVASLNSLISGWFAAIWQNRMTQFFNVLNLV